MRNNAQGNPAAHLNLRNNLNLGHLQHPQNPAHLQFNPAQNAQNHPHLAFNPAANSNINNNNNTANPANAGAPPHGINPGQYSNFAVAAAANNAQRNSNSMLYGNTPAHGSNNTDHAIVRQLHNINNGIAPSQRPLQRASPLPMNPAAPASSAAPPQSGAMSGQLQNPGMQPRPAVLDLEMLLKVRAKAVDAFQARNPFELNKLQSFLIAVDANTDEPSKKLAHAVEFIAALPVTDPRRQNLPTMTTALQQRLDEAAGYRSVAH